jgi:hypothetical protein
MEIMYWKVDRSKPNETTNKLAFALLRKIISFSPAVVYELHIFTIIGLILTVLGIILWVLQQIGNAIGYVISLPPSVIQSIILGAVGILVFIVLVIGYLWINSLKFMNGDAR